MREDDCARRGSHAHALSAGLSSAVLRSERPRAAPTEPTSRLKSAHRRPDLRPCSRARRVMRARHTRRVSEDHDPSLSDSYSCVRQSLRFAGLERQELYRPIGPAARSLTQDVSTLRGRDVGDFIVPPGVAGKRPRLSLIGSDSVRDDSSPRAPTREHGNERDVVGAAFALATAGVHLEELSPSHA